MAQGGGGGGVGGPSEGPEDNIVCYLSSHSWNQVTQKHICNLGIAYLLPFREKLPKVGWKRRHDSLNIVWWIIEKTEIILSKLGKSQEQLTWLPICGSIYSYHSKCHILHSFKSKCYFRNFRSSPAEQRAKVKVTRGGERGETTAEWRSWRSCRLTDMRGGGWRPSRLVNISHYGPLVSCFVHVYLSQTCHNLTVISNWISSNTSGMACKCKGWGMEDGQGWPSVYRAGGRGA